MRQLAFWRTPHKEKTFATLVRESKPSSDTGGTFLLLRTFISWDMRACWLETKLYNEEIFDTTKSMQMLEKKNNFLLAVNCRKNLGIRPITIHYKGFCYGEDSFMTLQRCQFSESWWLKLWLSLDLMTSVDLMKVKGNISLRSSAECWPPLVEPWHGPGSTQSQNLNLDKSWIGFQKQPLGNPAENRHRFIHLCSMSLAFFSVGTPICVCPFVWGLVCVSSLSSSLPSSQ